METASLILQLIIALGIFNVWILRFNKSSEWRGGEANNMREEFAAYGLPNWFVIIIGTAKLLFAVGLIAGIWLPKLIEPSAIGIAVLMLGAIVMHLKVSDPLKKSLPAFVLLLFSLIVLLS